MVLWGQRIGLGDSMVGLEEKTAAAVEVPGEAVVVHGQSEASDAAMAAVAVVDPDQAVALHSQSEASIVVRAEEVPRVVHHTMLIVLHGALAGEDVDVQAAGEHCQRDAWHNAEGCSWRP